MESVFKNQSKRNRLRESMPPVPGKLFCGECNDYHDIEEFSKVPSKKDGRSTYCRKVTVEHQAARNLKRKLNKADAWGALPI